MADNRKYEKYDDTTREYLARNRLPSHESSAPVRVTSLPMPYTSAGIPGLTVRDMPFLSDTNSLGFVLNSNALKNEMSNRTMKPNIFVRPDADNHTIGHETEHLLARQNLGFSQSTRDKFEELLKESGTKPYLGTASFLNGLAESLPYLKEKYGISDGYMDKGFIRRDGSVGLHELLATLAGAESTLGVDLTKDPELRKTMFKDKSVREAYNAVTGLRQTRLDPRDIAPYTRVEEPAGPGITDKLKSMLGFANGGMVPDAGNTKLI
jgi:hypothetical protein